MKLTEKISVISSVSISKKSSPGWKQALPDQKNNSTSTMLTEIKICCYLSMQTYFSKFVLTCGPSIHIKLRNFYVISGALKCKAPKNCYILYSVIIPSLRIFLFKMQATMLKHDI